MESLQLFDLYHKSNENKDNTFINKVDSSLKVVTNYNKVECNFEWLDIMEETIRYIDNILRNPNRFIINEEDIVKVELARRVTVESIKHLSRNTNLIQDIDKKTGDVRPSKILNINKEESYETYENRFIYSLIQNMRSYVARKKRSLVVSSSEKDDKKMEYNASTKVGDEKVNINVSLAARKDSEDKHEDASGNDVLTRIEKLENRITDLTSNQTYQIIHKKHLSLVTSPIKKTNLILKNTNFQYALRLWDYMQTHMDSDVKDVKDNKDYFDNGDLKRYLDESFLLDYLVIDTLSHNAAEQVVDKSEVTERLIGNVVQKVIDINENQITQEQLQNLVSKQYEVIKYRTVVNDREIYKIFKKYMDKYLSTINVVKI